MGVGCDVTGVWVYGLMFVKGFRFDFEFEFGFGLGLELRLGLGLGLWLRLGSWSGLGVRGKTG